MRLTRAGRYVTAGGAVALTAAASALAWADVVAGDAHIDGRTVLAVILYAVVFALVLILAADEDQRTADGVTRCLACRGVFVEDGHRVCEPCRWEAGDWDDTP